MISLKLIADLLWLPVELIVRCFSVPIKKNLYRLTFFFTDPKSIVDHLRLYLYKRNLRYVGRATIEPEYLELGHSVAEDSYFWSRAFRIQSLYNLEEDISCEQMLAVSDDYVKVLCKDGKGIVLNGNGRVHTLRRLNFQNKLEVEFFVLTSSTED